MSLTQHYITTCSSKKKEWQRIVYDGVKTNYAIRKNGDLKNIETDKILVPSKGTDGYLIYNLYVDKKMYRIRQHRILACIFIPIPKNLYDKGGLVCDQTILEVNHKDSDRTNNDLYNLEWVTHQGNMDHAKEHDRMHKGEYTAITTKQAIKVIKLLEGGKHTVGEIANIIGTSRPTIDRIYQRIYWTELSEGHDFSNVPMLIVRNKKDDIRYVCELLDTGKYSISEVRDLTGVSKDIIHKVYKRILWIDVSKDYNFDNVPKSRNSVLARKICEALQNGNSVSDTAEMYDVSKSMVRDIYNRKSHVEISKDYDFTNTPNRRLSDDIIHQVCAYIESGEESDVTIARELDGTISITHISDIRNRKARTDISQYYYFPGDKGYEPMAA